MTGSGSPCGACKFLRRKCARGCVFAPYFCHDQGVAHFAAIHKVFGASNFSKLLVHLPMSDRREAAVTISYEAQARLQDPIHGCVSHIFALQQQVISLQAQLASLEEQAAQSLLNGCPPSNPNEKCYEKLSSNLENMQSYQYLENSRMVPLLDPNLTANLYMNEVLMGQSCLELHDPNESVMPDENWSVSFLEEASHSMGVSFDKQRNDRKWAFQDTDDLQAVPFSYS